ncbi:MAG: hypothetical protein IKN27_00880 [Selenomonadaceae bacterium]|nr:hypothetical protein [Selenomonadaceae bacterium]
MVNLDYLYNPDAAKKVFGKNYFVDKKLGFRVIENGMILPHKFQTPGQLPKNKSFGGIVDDKGQFIGQSYVFDGKNFDGSYPPPKPIFNTAQKQLFI